MTKALSQVEKRSRTVCSTLAGKKAGSKFSTKKYIQITQIQCLSFVQRKTLGALQAKESVNYLLQANESVNYSLQAKEL